MRFPSKAVVEVLRRQYPVGTRVELVRMDDPQAPPIGTKGTVRGVDDIGSIMVVWDNGCGLCPLSAALPVCMDLTMCAASMRTVKTQRAEWCGATAAGKPF